MVQQGVLFIDVLIRYAVVGQQDDERIAPRLSLAEAFDEVAQATVEVVEGVKYLVVKLLDRNVPRFVAAQCGEADEGCCMVVARS